MRSSLPATVLPPDPGRGGTRWWARTRLLSWRAKPRAPSLPREWGRSPSCPRFVSETDNGCVWMRPRCISTRRFDMIFCFAVYILWYRHAKHVVSSVLYVVHLDKLKTIAWLWLKMPQNGGCKKSSGLWKIWKPYTGPAAELSTWSKIKTMKGYESYESYEKLWKLWKSMKNYVSYEGLWKSMKIIDLLCHM